MFSSPWTWHIKSGRGIDKNDLKTFIERIMLLGGGFDGKWLLTLEMVMSRSLMDKSLREEIIWGSSSSPKNQDQNIVLGFHSAVYRPSKGPDLSFGEAYRLN